MKYRLSREADSDLRTIYRDGVRRFGPVIAKKYLANLRLAMERLSDFPQLARERLELRPAVRILPVGVHLIVYRIDAETVLIQRIPHGHEDWQADLASDDGS